jgi:hypothetical protein
MQAALAAASLLLVPTLSEASSHREAPFIARMPKVDNTDFYMFRSYESGRAGFVTIIANFQPLQDAYGGPNYFTMDPDALYEIHIDNSGDAKEDLTFQFRFQNPLNDASGQTGITLDIGPTGMTQKVSIPFINANLPGAPANPLTAANQASFRNIREAYTMKVVRGDRRTGMAGDITNAAGGGTSFVKPLDFVGTKTFGSVAEYDTYANQHIYNAKIPAGPTACTAGADIKVFVGQRQEGFAVLLGNIFDLVNASAAQLTDAAGGTLGNPIGNKNVTTIALEVPIACLKGASDVIGGWSTASVRQARAINPNATYGRPSREGGAWAQVSRLGSPLVNEVVIGIKDKDKFNSSKPSDDVANFGVYITNPTLPAVLEGLFGAANVKAPTVFPRTDLLAAFATGVPGVNAFPGSPTPAEMLRLNTALPATPKGSQQRLGAALCFKAGATPNDPKVLDTGNPGCDPAGFPNGRRPGDDTVDIALRVAMGYLLGSGVGTSTRAPNADLPLGDFVPQNDSQFLDAFPYLNAPNPGAQ